MSYKPRSLFTLIEDVNRNIFLPHIQRPFVWEREQMCRLFDSLMRNYPIQTFLFWRTKEFIKARKFMESVEWDPDLSDYYDEPRSAAGVEKVFVLDGQQRLQTLFALFAGSVRDSEKGPALEAYADVTDGESPDEDGVMYGLNFASASPGPEWYRLRDLREADGQRNAEEIADAINERLDAVRVDEASDTRRAREKRVRRCVGQICSLLREEKHFWVETLDGVAQPYPYRTVLDIFVRVNSGGTRLEPADLMFAAMKEGSPDIEERVEEVASMLNGDGLAFDKSTVLKCLLVAHGKGAEATPEKFDGDTGKATIRAIDDAWSTAQAAFEQLHDFVKHDLRLSSDGLVRSYSAFVPLFDFLFHNPKPDDAARSLMRAYFYKAQLFNWYRARTDQLLNALHGVVGKSLAQKFPLVDVCEYFVKETRELTAAHLLDNRLRVILLHLVYVDRFGSDPFNFKSKGNAPQIDHIYPQSALRKDLGFDSVDVNHLGNFRFVGGTENNRKRAEKPASYFARLKSAGVPIEKHLLVNDYAGDPGLLVWSREAYLEFRDRRLAEIESIAKRVVNASGLSGAPRVNVYFFKHSLGRYRALPGRYPFSVRAAALLRTGTQYVRQGVADRTIYADGYGPNATGPNVDPNVFSEVLPWFLTFCLISAKDKHRVFDLTLNRRLPGPISRIVAPGDIIVFGCPIGNTTIAVDTVMCVGATVQVPVTPGPRRKNPFAFRTRFARYATAVGGHVPSFARLSWQQFTASDDFRLNVVDALTTGEAHAILGYPRDTHHKTTSLLNHSQVIGRWGDVPDTVEADTLLEVFLSGQGFNFIPGAAPPPETERIGTARTHPGLLTIRTGTRHGLPDRGVARLPPILGRDVLERIFATADQLVFGRIDWTARQRFTSAFAPPYPAAP